MKTHVMTGLSTRYLNLNQRRKTMGNYCTECGDSHEDEWEELCPTCLEFEQGLDFDNELCRQANEEYERFLINYREGKFNP